MLLNCFKISFTWTHNKCNIIQTLVATIHSINCCWCCCSKKIIDLTIVVWINCSFCCITFFIFSTFSFACFQTSSTISQGFKIAQGKIRYFYFSAKFIGKIVRHTIKRIEFSFNVRRERERHEILFVKNN